MRVVLASVIAMLSIGCASRAAVPGAATVVPLLSAAESETRSFRTLRRIEGRTCTTRLRAQPDGSFSEGEVLARVRLAERATKANADAVANVECAREVRIGFGCPVGIVCYGEAIKFD